MIKKTLLLLIKIYQKTLSPDHSWVKYFYPRGACIYRPTCSQYMSQAIEEFGLGRGLWLGIKRLGRCHPWREPKFDPIINPNNKVQMPNQFQMTKEQKIII